MRNLSTLIFQKSQKSFSAPDLAKNAIPTFCAWQICRLVLRYIGQQFHSFYSEWYPRGRRGSPAKGVGGQKPREGSNPSHSAKNTHTPYGVWVFLLDFWDGIWTFSMQQSGGLLLVAGSTATTPWFYQIPLTPPKSRPHYGPGFFCVVESERIPQP